jgi:hypothetical protein
MPGPEARRVSHRFRSGHERRRAALQGVIHAVGPRQGEGDEEAKLVAPCGRLWPRARPSVANPSRSRRSPAEYSAYPGCLRPCLSEGNAGVALSQVSYACATNRYRRRTQGAGEMRALIFIVALPGPRPPMPEHGKGHVRRRLLLVHRGSLREGAGRDLAVSGYTGGSVKGRATSRFRAAAPGTPRR